MTAVSVPGPSSSSPVDVAAIKARVNAATEGPWEVTANGRVLPPPPRLPQFSLPRELDAVAEAGKHADAEFIAHARSDVPALLSALAVERRRREQAEAVVEAVKCRLRGGQFIGVVGDTLTDELARPLTVPAQPGEEPPDASWVRFEDVGP